MVQFSRWIFLLSLFAATFATPVKRTGVQVEADITSISTQVTNLDNAIQAFPATGGSLFGTSIAALLNTIHTDTTSLETTLNQGTSDVTATGALGETVGRIILSAVEALEPTILDALMQIAAKQPAFVCHFTAALPIGGIPALILQDLQTLKTETVAFANALIADLPADLKAEATTLANKITNGFNIAIAVYQ
ncbi:hydrophobic surface binding protein [Mycena rosella]|uniref:Hydrophobic surface binding protein n=1 Tax=Mycena rosella TaxID=1033263 RepID=A0AAD7G7M0_MYCRO|nr:hydrophobic surface binding protein [Mycena rosella]